MSNTNQLIIRQATLDDLSHIVTFTQSIHIQEDDQSIPTHCNFLINLKNWLSQELENPLNLFLIAEEQAKPVGFIGGVTIINDNGFLANPTKGLINLLWVEVEYRKKNIAQTLLNNIEACFNENAINLVEVSYTLKNQLAKGFWDKMEYKEHSVTARKFLADI